jgi:hypothetical protein
VLGVVFASYGTVFRDVIGLGSSVADFIYRSSTVGDVFSAWLDSLEAAWNANGASSLWSLVPGVLAGLLTAMYILTSMVVFWIAYIVFTFAYAAYGAVLYVSGPFVLALLPIRGVGQLARTYLVNLFTFMAWGIIYAVLQALMTAIHMGSMDQIMGSGSVLGLAKGASQMLLLSVVSYLFAFAIALIPFIASRVVRGDVGSTMMTMMNVVRTTAAAAVGTASAAMFGTVSGMTAGSAGAGAVASAGAGSGVSGGVAPRVGPAMTPVVAQPAGAGTTSPPRPAATPTRSSGPSTTSAGTAEAPVAPPIANPVMSPSFSLVRAAAWHAGYHLGQRLDRYANRDRS